jgi:hypothetical protein
VRPAMRQANFTLPEDLLEELRRAVPRGEQSRVVGEAHSPSPPVAATAPAIPRMSKLLLDSDVLIDPSLRLCGNAHTLVQEFRREICTVRPDDRM